MEDQPNQPTNQPEPTTTSLPVNETASTTTSAAATSSAIPAHKSHKVLYVIIAILAVLLIAAGVAIYLLFGKTSTKVVQPEKPNAQTLAKPSQAKIDAALAKFIDPGTGETWLPTPKKIAKQGYFKDSDAESAAEYYQVGSHGPNTLILGLYTMVGTEAELFEKTPGGQVSAAIHPDGDAVYDQDVDKYKLDEFAPSVKVDVSIHFDSLTLPPTFDLDKGYKVSKPSLSTLGDKTDFAGSPNAPKSTLIRKIGASSLYRDETANADTKLTSIGYHLHTPVGTDITLGYTPLDLDGSQFQWSSTPIDDKYYAITRGCGGRASSISRADNLTDSDFRQVAKSASGQKVYEVSDPASPLVQKAFSEYKDFSSGGTNDPNANISKADFVKYHSVIAYKDNFGQWLIFIRGKMAPAGGCAKPVVYLYPTHDQKVSVRVGANVKVSEPQYDPIKGWQNVLAHPDGKLVVNGVSYDSLFWEGPGKGMYPSITAGSIVPTSQAVSKIRQQLSEQGLNQKESDDFVAYWGDKLPKTKYVRLTWLNTADMNQLAPLTVSPKPDTTIRVFLDFEGLDAPVKLPTQNLQKVDRKGFTVVEWGGLSPYRLY